MTKTAKECIVLETVSFKCGNKRGVNGTDVLGILGTVACLTMEHLNSSNDTRWSPSMMLMSCCVLVFLLCLKMQIVFQCLSSFFFFFFFGSQMATKHGGWFQV